MASRPQTAIRPDLVSAARNGEVLAKIVARKREDVRVRMASRPLDSLRSGIEISDRSLVDALREPGVRFILECKRASPSKGMIREDFDAKAIALAYAPIADAVSVLTDEPYFAGSFDILRTVRAHVGVPVLCKDFVLTPYQVYEARSHGADAVLLMMSVLDDETARECLDVAATLAVDCLVEVHDEAELTRALALDAQIIGINNRDLKTLQTDLSTTERLAASVPSDRIVVSESGVYTRGDVDRLASQADAFLVGTSLMAHTDLAAAARALVYGRVKICGLRDAESARAARIAGACFGGLIFAKHSPRYIDPVAARALVSAVDLRWVGVFVDEDVDTVAELTARLELAAVQLHGREDESYVTALRQRLGSRRTEIWKGVGVAVDGVGALPQRYAGVDRLLFDTKANGQTGGTGKAFAWSTLSHHPELPTSILAGGLSPDNIVTARATGTWCLDVNSGVEDSPGCKSAAKIKRLFHELRGHGRTDLTTD